MNTLSRHISSYPKARTSTLAYLIEREKKHEQLLRDEKVIEQWLVLSLLRALRMWGR